VLAIESVYKNFSDNLRLLVASEGTIADLCRALNLNRQQFNKYLSGQGLPSRTIYARIAAHFEVQEIELMQHPESMKNRIRKRRKNAPHVSMFAFAPAEIQSSIGNILTASKEDIIPQGSYEVYYPWPLDPLKLIRSTMIIFKDQEILCFRRYSLLQGLTASLKNYPAARHDGIVSGGERGIYFLGRNHRGFEELSLISIGSPQPPRTGIWFGLALLMTPLSEPIATRCSIVYRGGQDRFRTLLKELKPGPTDPQSIEPEIYRSLVPAKGGPKVQINPYDFLALRDQTTLESTP
jgi:transcriptional regulator with XRE-family HTH domain